MAVEIGASPASSGGPSLLGGRPPGRHALLFILLTIFIDTVAFGIIIPVLPTLIAELGETSISDAAGYGGLLMFVFALMQFVFAPILGGLSDRFGRRPVLLLSLTVLGIDYLIMGFANSIFWLFLGRLIAGAAAATFATSNAYIADITPEAERAQKFGLIGAAWGIGFVMGPAIGGLLGDIDPRLPFFVAAGLALANVVYGLLVLPETLAPENQRPFSIKRANPVGAIRSMSGYPIVIGLFGAYVLYMIAHDVNPSVWTYYVLHKFDWSSAQIGVALAVVGLSGAVVSGTLVGPTVKALGEARTAYLGSILTALSFFGYAFASEDWMIYPCMVIGAGMGLIMPALRSVMSSAVPGNAQGELQGAIASIQGLTAIFSPLIMTQTFRYFSSPEAIVIFPGASFFLAGALMLATLVVVFSVLRARPAELSRS